MNMEAETAEIGSHPSVKELAKEALSKVPERYVRPDIDPPISSNTHSLPQIPVIDLTKLFLPQELKAPELKNLHLACKEWGFFQVRICIISLFLFHSCVFVIIFIINELKQYVTHIQS